MKKNMNLKTNRSTVKRQFRYDLAISFLRIEKERDAPTLPYIIKYRTTIYTPAPGSTSHYLTPF